MIRRKHKVPPVRRLPSLSGNEASPGFEDETPKRSQPPRAAKLHKRKLRKFKVFCCIIQTTYCQILHCGLKYSVHVISASSSSSSSSESEGTGSDSMSDWEKQAIADAKRGKTSSQKSAPQPAGSDSMSDWEKQVIAEAKRGKTSSQPQYSGMCAQWIIIQSTAILFPILLYMF